MNASRVFIMMGMAISMSLVACGGATDEFEQLAEQEGDLGEIGCATAGGNPYSGIIRNGKSVTPTACGTTQQFRSSGTTYTNGATCSNQYIAEVTNISGRKLSVFGVWRHDLLPLSAVNCDQAVIEVGTYMHNASTNTWNVHSTKYRGQWWGGSLGCVVWPDAGYTFPPGITGSEGYDVVRAAGKAYIEGRLGSPNTPVPVAIDIIYPPSPC